MAQKWDSHVNTKFYGEDGGYSGNREKVEFKSGRKIFYLKNSVPKKTHSVNLRCEDTEKKDGRTEFGWFLWWYETVIKSGTRPFYLEDITGLSGTKEYMITEEPSWNGQRYKEVSLQLEEI